MKAIAWTWWLIAVASSSSRSRWTGHLILWGVSQLALLKRRQLKYLGWRLVSVPYWEWVAQSRADKSMMHRQRVAYLGGCLDLTLASPGRSAAKRGSTERASHSASTLNPNAAVFSMSRHAP